MDEFSRLLSDAAGRAAHYRATLAERPVAGSVDEEALRARFGGPLPEGPSSPEVAVDRLVAAAEPGLVTSTGPRFFGFVIGGSRRRLRRRPTC